MAAVDRFMSPPTLPLKPQTIIFDYEQNQQVAVIDGVVVLPVGSVVQLGKPNREATVFRVRLLASESASVCLDVRLRAATGGD